MQVPPDGRAELAFFYRDGRSEMISHNSRMALEFIEGIREGLEDYAEGRCKVFKDADELLAYLAGP
jgi:hypothetical protein